MTGKSGKGEPAPGTPAVIREKVFPENDANARIATRLKALYDDVEQEPIPDMLLDLLEKLDAAESAAGKTR